MSKAADQFFANVKQPEQSMGAIEAVKEGVTAFLSQMKEMGGEAWDAAKPAFDHGRTEAAAALFNGSSGHVMYMRGTQGVEQGQDQAPDHGLVEPMKQPEVEQDRGGMGM
jgi:hypothetical protein